VAIQLDDVYAAAERIAALTFRTPLRLSEWLSGPDANVFLKLETVQPTCSYKIRGAFNAVQRFSDEGAADLRIVTASAGNHGRAMAYAAGMFDLPLTVFVPARRRARRSTRSSGAARSCGPAPVTTKRSVRRRRSSATAAASVSPYRIRTSSPARARSDWSSPRRTRLSTRWWFRSAAAD
jgi:threonine dehydratase